MSSACGPIANSMPSAGDAVDQTTARGLPGIFILSDVRLYREGLALCLSRQPSVAVLGFAESNAQALAQVTARKPDIVVLDIAGPGSFEFAKSLNGLLPEVKIIAFAVSEVEHEVLACAAAGFAGYVAREGSEEDLLAAIENAQRGELSCSPRMAALLFRHVAALSAQQRPANEPAVLTRREQQILALLGRGLSNKEIAREVRIGSATVKNHVHNLLEKFNVHRRGEAVARLRVLQHWGMARRQGEPTGNAQQAALARAPLDAWRHPPAPRPGPARRNPPPS